MKASMLNENPTETDLQDATLFVNIWLNDTNVLAMLTLKVRVTELMLPSGLTSEDLTIFWYNPDASQWIEVLGTFLLSGQLEAQLPKVGYFAVARGSEETTTAPLPTITSWYFLPVLVVSLLGMGILHRRRISNKKTRKEME